MRDPKRIKRILKMIEEVWVEMPDLRLGQLLHWVVGDPECDMFNVEDDLVEQNLERWGKSGT